MKTNLQFHAAERVPAAFGAVPAGLPALSVVRDSGITGTTITRMPQFHGQVRPPRKIPL